MSAGGAEPSASDAPRRVLVLGGYGAFGTRLCRLLARSPQLEIHVAGRSRASAERACAALGGTQLRAAVLDRDVPDGVARWLREHRPAVVVDAVGPFQGRDHALAKLVVEHGAHAIDLADDRAYVTGIGELDALARSRGVLVVSGASTVPALSAAAIDWLLEDMDALASIEIGISPGHRGPRGLATIRSILSYCGKPIPAVARGHLATRRGWGDLRRHRYPAPVGARWLSNVDVPDLALLPQRYPGIESVQIGAGLEIGALHLGLSFLSALVARGWIRSLVPWAGAMRRVADLVQPFGTDAGAMHVTLRGARGGRELARHWALVAANGDGPFIPATAAAVLVKRLCAVPGYAPVAARGAMPCVGLVALDEFLRELAGFAVRVVLTEEWLPQRR